MTRKFKKEVLASEWVGGTSYYFKAGGRFIKSSSLDELQEMFKAHYNGLPIPERKCFFHK